MTKYHINESGNPGQCKAKVRCRFGDVETEHYASHEEARDAYEAKQEQEETKHVETEKRLNSLNKLNARLVKNSIVLKNDINAVELAVKVASQKGDSEEFEKSYEKLQELDKKRKEIVAKQKDTQRLLVTLEKEKEKDVKKSSVAQLRTAREKTITTKAYLTKVKGQLKKAEDELQQGVASRLSIKDLKPAFETANTLKFEVEKAQNNNKEAMRELSKLEKLEPKRVNKPASDVPKVLTKAPVYSSCGGGRRRC